MLLTSRFGLMPYSAAQWKTWQAEQKSSWTPHQPAPKPSKRKIETVHDDVTTVIGDVKMLEFVHSVDVGKKVDADVVIQLAKHQFEKEAAASHELDMEPTERRKWRVRAGKQIQTARVRATLLELGYDKCA